MRVGRGISAAIATHAVLKTGVHSVGTDYLAKTSVAAQTLSDTEIPAAIARDTEVVTAVSDEATARDLAIADEATARDEAIAAEALLRTDAATAHAGLATVHQDAPTLIAAALAAANIPEKVRKTADQIVNNSATLVNDTHLLFAIAANEVWEFVIIFISQSSTVADIKFAIAVPVSATGYTMCIGRVISDDVKVTCQDIGAGSVMNALGKAANILCVIKGVVINAGNAGNVQFQWAQNGDEVSDTIVREDSCILAHKLV